VLGVVVIVSHRLDVSVVILTYNEDINLQDCLSSLSMFDDIHVIDSYSVDRTAAIAESNGVNFVRNKFLSFAQQRNFAHDVMPLKYDWVLHLDADERMTDALVDEISSKIRSTDCFNSFRIAGKTMLFDKFIPNCTSYPIYQVRLLRKSERFYDFGHGQKVLTAESKIAKLSAGYVHYNFSHGLEAWIKKHVKYAILEAEEIRKVRSQESVVRILKNRMDLRITIKKLTYFVPLIIRPILKFTHLYFIKRGFMEGRAGFIYCLLQFIYETMTVVFYYANQSRELWNE
jgi:glycosyltransferase involved in cell wall biosynthesis